MAARPGGVGGHGTAVGGAAPHQPFVLFPRDSHGGIIVGSPDRAKGKVGVVYRTRGVGSIDYNC